MQALHGLKSILGDVAQIGLLSYAQYATMANNPLMTVPNSSVQKIPTYVVPSTGEVRQPQFAIGPNVQSPTTEQYMNTVYVPPPAAQAGALAPAGYAMPQPIYSGMSPLPVSGFQQFVQENQLLIWGGGGMLLLLFVYMLMRK